MKILEKNGVIKTYMKTWHPNGAPAQEYMTEETSKENFSPYGFRYKHGNFSSKDSLGKVLDRGQYFYGAKIGAWIETDYKTGITSTTEYQKPALPGFDFYRFYENGKVQVQGNLKNGKPEGLWSYYSENGVLLREAENIDGQLSGEERKYAYYTGKLWARSQYLNGKEQGEQVTFFEDGTLQSRSFFENGIKQGEELLYQNPGQIRVKSFYKDGLLEGKYLSLDHKGDTSLVASFRRGALQGETTEYFRELKHCNKFSGRYENGFKTGAWRTFDCNGKQLQTCIFDSNSHNSNTYGSIYGGKCKPFE